MLKLICFSLLSVSATLEFYDMNGKLTMPYEWCDESNRSMFQTKLDESIDNNKGCFFKIANLKQMKNRINDVKQKEFELIEPYINFRKCQMKVDSDKKLDDDLCGIISSFLFLNESVNRTLNEYEMMISLQAFSNMCYQNSQLQKIKLQTVKFDKVTDPFNPHLIFFPDFKFINCNTVYNDIGRFENKSKTWRNSYSFTGNCNILHIKNADTHPLSLYFPGASNHVTIDGTFNFLYLNCLKENIKFESNSSCKKSVCRDDVNQNNTQRILDKFYIYCKLVINNCPKNSCDNIPNFDEINSPNDIDINAFQRAFSKKLRQIKGGSRAIK